MHRMLWVFMPHIPLLFMENKKVASIDKAGVSAPVFFLCKLIFVLVFATNKLSAQDPSKYYVSSSQPAGILYFVLPQTNFNNPDTKKDFVIDVTYLNSNDSAVVNFTYYDSEIMNLENICIAYDSWQYRTTVNRIYVDAEKKQWLYRYTFKIPFNQLVLFYRSKAPVITITTDSSRNIPIRTVKQWEKNFSVNNRIIQIIQKNKT